MNEELKVIISAEIDKLKNELEKGKKQVQNFGKQGTKTNKTWAADMKAIGDSCKKGLAIAGAAILGATVALLSLSASTAEYRNNQAKLNTAFQTAGSTAAQASTTYNELYRVLGDDGQAVEAAQHLAQLTTNQADLSTWTNITQGVYATFGASLPIESLTEAANETAKTGALTGALADALNWAGVNEDTFQKQLDKCNTEAEREALIRETLNGLYSDAATNYENNNAALLAQNEAQANLNSKMATLGTAMQPINTALTNFAAMILDQLTPYITEFAENCLPTLETVLTNVANAIGAVIGWIVDNWEFVSTLGTIILVAATAFSVFSTVMGIVNAVMAASPITWMVAAIVALIAIIALCVIYWDEIKAAMVNAWESAKAAWSKAVEWFKGVWTKIKTALTPAGTWFKTIFTKAWTGIKTAWASVPTFFSNIWTKIKTVFKNVGSVVATAITGTVKTAINTVLSAGIKIINGFISAINLAIDVINAIPGVSISKLTSLTVPAMAKGGVVDSATLAMIGENGKEAVVPLENNLGWLDKLAGMLNDRMGGNAPIVLQVDGKTFAQVSCDSINQLTRIRGSIPLNLV